MPKTPQPLRVVLWEPEPFAADAMRQALRTLGAEVIEAAGTGAALLQVLERHNPTVLLAETSVGLAAVARIHRQFPQLAIVLISANPTPQALRQALQAGVRGFLVKETLGRIETALRSALAGRVYVTPLLRQALAAEPEPPLAVLSPRQQQVLNLIARGYSNKQIAPALRLSVKTVDTHRTALMRRLGIHQVAGLVRYAIAAGLVGAHR